MYNHEILRFTHNLKTWIHIKIIKHLRIMIFDKKKIVIALAPIM